MSSENSNYFTKENLNTYLKELGKEYKKINGKSMPAEISAEETKAKGLLINFEQDYPGVTNTANVDDILKNLKKKRIQIKH